MKKIGLIGGMSWVSTMDYYKLINEGINQQLGGLNYAECLLYSLNFADIQKKSWGNAYELLLKAAESLKQSEVDFLVLCANTAHLYADQIQETTGLPLIHIADEAATVVKKAGLKKVGLLGTKFTMEMDFYTGKLAAAGLEVLVPEKQETRNYIQETLRDELGKGIFRPETKGRYLTIIDEVVSAGAEGIILGCTEIPMFIKPEEIPVPAFDTMQIHSRAIVDYALNS